MTRSLRKTTMSHPIRTVLLVAALAAGAARAEETLPDPGTHDAARQERMDEAYRNHRFGESGVARAVDATRRDAKRAGHEFHEGLRATGHAINQGVHATGHAIHRGLQATGHAIHRGVGKVTGK